MMNKIKIKTKLILYSFMIQLFILTSSSFALYSIYKESTLDTIFNTLDVILYDLYHELEEENNESIKRKLNDLKRTLDIEEENFNRSHLELRVSQIKDGQIYIIKSTGFPKGFNPSYEKVKDLELEEPEDEIRNGYIYEMIKGEVRGEYYLFEAVTTQERLSNILNELLYSILLIVPLVLIFSTIGNYFLIYQSFKPIKDLLGNLKNIQASSLSNRLKRNNNKDEIDQLNEEINALLGRLEFSFDKISQFSTNASHELKTPLTIIRGEIELALRKDREKQEYKQTLENCQSEVLSIQQTVDHLLFLAKSKDYLEDNIEENYLDEITLDSINELKSYAKLKKVYLDCKIQEALSINGNKELLKVAIKNIIKNAISFSFENRTVQIKNYSDDNFNIISIQDSGIGIKKSEQKKIFEEFYRTDKSRNKDSGGTGLGLTICEKIVKMHKGTIKLESQENLGTTVYLKFEKHLS